MRTFSAYIEWDPETRLYVGIVPGIPGGHTQGATLDELHGNLKEVLELCLEEYRGVPGEHVAEETGDEVILIKDREGHVIGFERLNFSIPAEEQLSVDALAV